MDGNKSVHYLLPSCNKAQRQSICEGFRRELKNFSGALAQINIWYAFINFQEELFLVLEENTHSLIM